MELINLLRSVDMFSGLTDEQLAQVAGIFEVRSLEEGEVLFRQGEIGDTMCLIRDGFVSVTVETGESPAGRTIVNLGPGQSVGEMALIDHGPRSATVRAATPGTQIAAVTRAALERLCEENTEIGYRIMRNIAADLSFRIRHSGLAYS